MSARIDLLGAGSEFCRDRRSFKKFKGDGVHPNSHILVLLEYG
jgi:hypothetical protein